MNFKAGLQLKTEDALPTGLHHTYLLPHCQAGCTNSRGIQKPQRETL